jgi:hypothetical protein
MKKPETDQESPSIQNQVLVSIVKQQLLHFEQLQLLRRQQQQLNDQQFLMVTTFLGFTYNPLNPTIQPIPSSTSLRRQLRKQFGGRHRQPFDHPQLI